MNDPEDTAVPTNQELFLHCHRVVDSCLSILVPILNLPTFSIHRFIFVLRCPINNTYLF